MKQKLIEIPFVFICRITHQLQNDKGGSIEFASGGKFNVSKGKNGHLIVVSTDLNIQL